MLALPQLPHRQIPRHTPIPHPVIPTHRQYMPPKPLVAPPERIRRTTIRRHQTAIHQELHTLHPRQRIRRLRLHHKRTNHHRTGKRHRHDIPQIQMTRRRTHQRQHRRRSIHNKRERITPPGLRPLVIPQLHPKLIHTLHRPRMLHTTRRTRRIRTQPPTLRPITTIPHHRNQITLRISHNHTKRIIHIRPPHPRPRHIPTTRRQILHMKPTTMQQIMMKHRPPRPRPHTCTHHVRPPVIVLRMRRLTMTTHNKHLQHPITIQISQHRRMIHRKRTPVIRLQIHRPNPSTSITTHHPQLPITTPKRQIQHPITVHITNRHTTEHVTTHRHTPQLRPGMRQHTHLGTRHKHNLQMTIIIQIRKTRRRPHIPGRRIRPTQTPILTIQHIHMIIVTTDHQLHPTILIHIPARRTMIHPIRRHTRIPQLRPIYTIQRIHPTIPLPLTHHHIQPRIIVHIHQRRTRLNVTVRPYVLLPLHRPILTRQTKNVAFERPDNHLRLTVHVYIRDRGRRIQTMTRVPGPLHRTGRPIETIHDARRRRRHHHLHAPIHVHIRDSGRGIITPARIKTPQKAAVLRVQRINMLIMKIRPKHDLQATIRVDIPDRRRPKRRRSQIIPPHNPRRPTTSSRPCIGNYRRHHRQKRHHTQTGNTKTYTLLKHTRRHTHYLQLKNHYESIKTILTPR